jgi:hypothetical protein
MPKVGLVAQVVCDDMQLAVSDPLSELVVQPAPQVWFVGERLFVPGRAKRNDRLLET